MPHTYTHADTDTHTFIPGVTEHKVMRLMPVSLLYITFL